MADIWQNLALKDVFPSQSKAFEDIFQKAGNLHVATSSVADQLIEKVNTLNQIISQTQGLLNAINESGFYTLMMPPDNGGIVQRIETAQNSPPVGGYSAGIVIAVSATDIQTVINRYQKLTDILTKPVNIPE